MPTLQKIAPHLWFDSQAEDAAKFYVATFKRSKLGRIARYPAVGQEIHKRQPGSIMTVEFELDGQPFLALNGGPIFKFNEAISFVVYCDTQEEIDELWDKLTFGGDPNAQQCGWLKDKFGVSWQIVPRIIPELMASNDPAVAERAMAAFMKMKKLDIATIERAAKLLTS